MVILITVIHIAVCLFLIIVVLLQSGKSGDIAAAFGGMGSQTAFGPRGAATVLSRATTWSAIIFMVTSITLSVYASRRGVSNSVLQGVKAAPVKTQPVTPAAPPAVLSINSKGAEINRWFVSHWSLSLAKRRDNNWRMNELTADQRQILHDSRNPSRRPAAVQLLYHRRRDHARSHGDRSRR